MLRIHFIFTVVLLPVLLSSLTSSSTFEPIRQISAQDAIETPTIESPSTTLILQTDETVKMEPPTSTQQPSSTFHWELSTDPASDYDSLPQQNLNDWSQPLRGKNVSINQENNQLILQGQESPEQLRSALFDLSRPMFEFLGSRVELTIYLSSDGATPLTLDLEARTTAGYRWEIVPDRNSLFSYPSKSEFTSRSPGIGTPAVQSIQFEPAGSGETTVRLVYGRPFEPNEPVLTRLKVWLPTDSHYVDLSDPTPSSILTNPDSETKTLEENPIEDLPLQALPSSWDWRNQGIVPPIRNQGNCGSCWAFGTVGAAESAVRKAGLPLYDFSEQFLVSCNKYFWSCDGGLTAHTYHYNTLGKNQNQVGMVLEADKPYTATDGSCNVAYNHPNKLSGWLYVSGSEWSVPSVDQIKNAIYTYGPVTAAVCVGDNFQDYPGGIFSTNENCGGFTNHMIVLVGWNDTGQYWILRNSWSAYWGESGYMRIKWNTSRVGEGTSWVTALSYKDFVYLPFSPSVYP